MNQQDQHPGWLLEISGMYWKTCTLHAAVKLDIFTAIGKEKLASDAISSKLNGNARAVKMLLNALTAMNLLNHHDDIYENTPASLKFLSKDSPDYVGYIIQHHYHLVGSWNQLNTAVRTGQPVRKSMAFSDEEMRESFLMGMFNIASNVAPRLVKSIDMSHRRHLLDLGGGPGTYAIFFCKHNPQLKGTVYDLPTSRHFAENVAARFGMKERVNFIGGNYFEDDIPGTYDAVWLSQILHAESPANCRMIIQKAVAVLEPGGSIYIHEFILNNSMDSPLFPTLFSLNMLLGTDGGQAYSEKQIMDMLAEAGVKDVQRLDFQGPNDSGIVFGHV